MQTISLYQAPNHLEIVEQWNASFLGLLAGVKRKYIVQILANRYNDIDYKIYNNILYLLYYICLYLYIFHKRMNRYT